MSPRAPFWTILLAAVLAIVGCTPAPSPQPLRPGQYGDKRLYRDIAAEVSRGVPYHAAAVRLQRAHHYPVKPGLTVRLPTLSWAAATVGWRWLRGLAFALLAIGALAWLLALRHKAFWPERLAAAALIVGSAGMLTGDPMIIHERWAGLFLSLALAIRLGWRDAWPASLAAAGLALAVRELALPFALLALAFALWERRWREAVGWIALIVIFAALLFLHLQEVAMQVRPGDLGSAGWMALGGPLMTLSAIVNTSPLQYLPFVPALVLAALPLLGWLSLPGHDRLFCLALFLGYGLMIALFARPDNFYWGGLVQPGWFVGLALLPRATLRAWQALRGMARLARAAGS